MATYRDSLPSVSVDASRRLTRTPSVRVVTDIIPGSLTGEIDDTYSNISSANELPTWPVVGPNRWNVLLDYFIVGTQTHSVSTNVSGAPSTQAVVLLDSGTSYT